MAQNISIAGAAFENVPAIEVPLTAGGGNAVFYDETVLDGKIDKSVQASKTSSQTQEVGIDANGKLWTAPGGGSAAWGGITGTLSNQTDLNTVLSSKANDSGVVHKSGNETMTSPKMIVGDDAEGDTSGQPALLKVIYDGSASSGTIWKGRAIVGAKNLTFLLGTYNGLAGIGAHSWTDVTAGTGAAWAPIYLNPDGTASVFIGGSGWTANTGILEVRNSDSKVYYNGSEIAKKSDIPSYTTYTGW